MNAFLAIILALLACFQITNSFSFSKNHEKTLNKCDQCKTLVDSFKNGLKRTSRGKHEGGDAHWEESKLKNYFFSEIRFVDIQDNLCEDSTTSKDQCYAFAEEYENELEEWFLNNLKIEYTENKEEGSTLFQHLCHDISKSCCDDGHFGADCKRCNGFPDNVCHSRGYCDGNGTRSGTGKCICFDGFTGENCEKCDVKHISIGETESTLNNETHKIPEKCLKCDRSCDNSCTSLGPKGCLVCAKGYEWNEEYGCADVDECHKLEVNPCSESKYCSNTIGSYDCLRCNSACATCSGPGPDSCIECAEGYHKTGNSCFKIGKTLPQFLFIIPGIFGLIIFKISNFWFASTFVILYALTIKLFEERILTMM